MYFHMFTMLSLRRVTSCGTDHSLQALMYNLVKQVEIFQYRHRQLPSGPTRHQDIRPHGTADLYVYHEKLNQGFESQFSPSTIRSMGQNQVIHWLLWQAILSTELSSWHPTCDIWLKLPISLSTYDGINGVNSCLKVTCNFANLYQSPLCYNVKV